jgi:hypothetical protein
VPAWQKEGPEFKIWEPPKKKEKKIHQFYVTFKSLKYQHKQLKGMIYLFWLAASKGSVHGFLAPCTRAYHHGSKNEWGSREK